MASNASVKKFQRVLAALPAETRAPIEDEVFRQAALMAEGMRIKAHDESGVLRRSIRVERSNRGPLIALVRAGGPTTTVVSTAGRYDYALANEFGTAKMPARPFFWPVYRARKAQTRRAIKQVAKAAIGKLVALK